MRLSLCVFALLCATPALAQGATSDSWVTSADTVRASAAGIALPQQAGPGALVKTGEIAQAGSDTRANADIYAQFLSDDEVVQASVFIYRPGYADATLAALATERALSDRFGADTRRAAQKITAAGDKPGTALRLFYTGAADGQLSLASAFIQAGPWIVKLRVTATSDRAHDVKAAMAALLAGLRFDGANQPQHASLISVQDCAAATPQTPLCRRDVIAVGDARFDMLQSAQAGSQGTIFVPTDDAGGLLRFDPVAGSTAYRLTRYGMGKYSAGGNFAALPSGAHMADLIAGHDTRDLAVRPPSGGPNTVLRDVAPR